MYRQAGFVAIFVVTWIIVPAMSPAWGWNSPGHIIVGLIAYDQMDSDTKAKAVALIRAHPRFRDHFQSFMPREVSRGDGHMQDEWLFAYAGTWPDVVRSANKAVNHQDVSEYSRPWWHFINQPIYLNDEERRKLEPELRVNRMREPPEKTDDANMNVVQAGKNSTRVVRDTSTPIASRSVHLCWLIHLVGDSHQPLHSSALYTTHRFRDGDHGGNFLEFEHDWDLHAFWDSQISTDEPYDTIRVLATDLRNNQELAAAGNQAARSLDVGTWIDEGHELAKQHVYSKEVLQKAADRDGHSHLGELDRPTSYKADAEMIAERRAVEAGYRLARLFEQLLD